MTQNNTPAIEISTIISNLNEKFANIIANKEKYYAQTVPSIIEKIVKLGADNVFYMYQNYRGLYEDDDCTFYYWDNVNGKVITDFWGTHFAAPDFRLYTENVLTFSEASNMGLVNMELLKKYNIEKVLQSVERTRLLTDENSKIIMNHNPLINVTRGRKFKGLGYYIGEVETRKSLYYPATIEAKVLSLEDFQIHYCNPNFIQLVEKDELVEGYIKWATNVINEVVSKNSYSSFFDMKGVNWGIKREDFSLDAYVKKHKDSNIEYFINTAYDPREEERKKQRAEKMTQEYANILEWVKNKTDKTTESEQIALATKILYKKF